MSTTNSRRAKKDKYSSASEPTFMIHKGQKVVFGVPEMLRHCDAQWYAYLERLVNNPKEQNPFERYEGADLRQGLKDRGYIGKSQAQLRANSAEYLAKLAAGQPAYSDTELYGVEWIPAN